MIKNFWTKFECGHSGETADMVHALLIEKIINHHNLQEDLEEMEEVFISDLVAELQVFMILEGHILREIMVKLEREMKEMGKMGKIKRFWCLWELKYLKLLILSKDKLKKA